MKPVFQSALRAACAGPTCVYEPSRRAFAELFGLVRQSDLDDPGDVSGRRLHPDGMRRDQLEKEGKGGGKKSVRRNSAAPDQDNATHNHWNNSERFLCQQTCGVLSLCSRVSLFTACICSKRHRTVSCSFLSGKFCRSLFAWAAIQSLFQLTGRTGCICTL